MTWKLCLCYWPFCEGNPPVDSSHRRPVLRTFHNFFVVVVRQKVEQRVKLPVISDALRLCDVTAMFLYNFRFIKRVRCATEWYHWSFIWCPGFTPALSGAWSAYSTVRKLYPAWPGRTGRQEKGLATMCLWWFPCRQASFNSLRTVNVRKKIVVSYMNVLNIIGCYGLRLATGDVPRYMSLWIESQLA